MRMSVKCGDAKGRPVVGVPLPAPDKPMTAGPRDPLQGRCRTRDTDGVNQACIMMVVIEPRVLLGGKLFKNRGRLTMHGFRDDSGPARKAGGKELFLNEDIDHCSVHCRGSFEGCKPAVASCEGAPAPSTCLDAVLHVLEEVCSSKGPFRIPSGVSPGNLGNCVPACGVAQVFVQRGRAILRHGAAWQCS